jgi:SMODS-associating 4TM effector domain
MNWIPTAQNSERQLQRLAAQRALYARAKTIFGWHAFASGPFSVGLAFAAAGYPPAKSYVALFGVALALLDLTYLTPWQKRIRTSAARIQELFDCDVLELPWDELRAGPRPDPELIKEQSDQYKKRAASMPPVSNWYPPDVGELPLPLARLVCQRANCWWDAKQRRRYSEIVLTCLVVMFVAVLALAMRNGLTVDDFVVKVVAPLAPALLLGYRQVSEQRDAAERMERLREHAERLWRSALADGIGPDAIQQSRRLQDEIFESRTRSPLVFDRVFRMVRSSLDAQMNHGAAELVVEATHALAKTTAPTSK